MSDSTPLYNSRIAKIYLEYLASYYSELNVENILDEADITKEDVEDPAHWFSQSQVDRFQEVLIKQTGDPHIAREAGRYAASSKALGVAKHYMLGLLSLASLYLLIGKVYSVFSKAVTIKGKKLGVNKVEIISTPKPGVNEKPYQCENRVGMFESVARLFTPKYAQILQTSCFHQGADCCRYVITWDKKPFVIWKQIRNFSLLFWLIMSSGLWFVLPVTFWGMTTLSLGCLALASSIIPIHLEKKELNDAIETQGNIAKNLLDEMEIRHNNASLIQEIGQTISHVLDIDKLIEAVVNSMKTYMDFDRGLIMLSDKNKKSLVYKAAYGYPQDKTRLLRETEFNLANPNSQGIFILSYKHQKPFLINDFAEIEQKLSSKSLNFARQMQAQSMICAPIIYKNESLGVLAVDNINSKRPLTKSDLSFITGVASQVAISIVNAMSYQKLQESERKYRDLVENANSIILRRDINGKITFFNEFAQKFFGYEENEILGKNLEDTILENNESAHLEFDQLVASLRDNPGKNIISESEIILRNGRQTWITWTYKPIFDHNGKLMEMLCIGNDITELKMAAIEKKELEARLQRAQKMEAIGTLAGGVAHDLNNILSGIVSYPELLLMDLPADSRLRKPISTIQKAGERAAAIVQDLLTLARRGVVSTKVVNLNTIMDEYLKSPECDQIKVYHPNVTISFFPDKSLLNISGSSVHLTKTIMNLVNNAAEAITNSGEITITTKNKYVDQIINGFDKVNEGDYVILSVTDTGVGISPKDIERIFEPFYTKKVMGKSGTGLGMAVVWGTIKDHNGYIDIKSVEGKGTTFTLYFPATRKEVKDAEVFFSFNDIQGKGEKILVVDDVEEQREIALAMLKKLSYSAEAVSSGKEAITYLRKNSVDVVMLDMILGEEMDGLEVYKKILEFKPGQKAIIASGYSESIRVKEAQKLGAGAYLKKPYLLEKIAKVIKDELDN
jgi:PAS domain S-box-containing protein